MEIFTPGGSCLGRHMVNGESVEMDLSSLAPGIYIVSLRTRESVFMRKIVKAGD